MASAQVTSKVAWQHIPRSMNFRIGCTWTIPRPKLLKYSERTGVTNQSLLLSRLSHSIPTLEVSRALGTTSKGFTLSKGRPCISRVLVHSLNFASQPRWPRWVCIPTLCLLVLLASDMVSKLSKWLCWFENFSPYTFLFICIRTDIPRLPCLFLWYSRVCSNIYNLVCKQPWIVIAFSTPEASIAAQIHYISAMFQITWL